MSNELENKGNISENNDIDDFSGFEQRYNKSEAEQQVQEVSAQMNNNDAAASVNKKRILTVIISAVAVIVLLAGGVFVYGATLPEDKVIGGVKVGGVDIGGLSISQACEKIEKAPSVINSEVIINANGRKYIILPEEVEVKLDINATAKKAFDIAKSGNAFMNGISALKLKLSGNNLMPVITYDVEKFAARINEIGLLAVGSVLKEHSIRIDENGKAFVVPGVSGYNNDPSRVMSQIDRALVETDSKNIDVDFEITSPAAMTIDLLDSLMYSEPMNASFAFENGQVVVVPAQDGRYIDKNACKHLVSQVKEGGPEIEVPYMTTPAQLDSEAMKAKLFNGKLASYTTRYAAGGNRGSNVANAARKINGKILMPGDTFSFNETVGRRTVANGFKTAPEYQNGQTVDGIGGGTCQVSTTVYSAALYADLKIDKRTNHSMSVSYVPLGQDATVTDGGLDLKFTNNTEYPVKIEAVTGGGKITVTIIGTTPDIPKTVKISHKPVSVAVGSAVKTIRYVYDENGNVIKEEDMGVSRYKPHSEPETTTSAATSAPSAQPDETSAPEATQSVQGEETVAPTKAPEVTQAPVNTPSPTKAPEALSDKTPVKSESEE